jgi:phosphatidate cytidylyltransferase
VLIAAFSNPIYCIILTFPPPWTMGDRPNLAWRFGGFLWITLPSIAFVYLRDLPQGGLAITVWLLLLVWATDIAAFIAGRTIGGPKLAPSISPKKTWAGLAGGVFGAALIGLAVGNMLQPSRWWQIALLSAMLAVVEQMGDLAESYAKRRFGAKDSSRLIPGHGGFLDRLDGMLVVAFAMALFCWGTGENLLLWK